MEEIKAAIIQARGSAYEIGKNTAAAYAKNPILQQFSQLASQQTNYEEIKALFSDYAPHLLDELQGLADGLGLSLQAAAALYSGYNLPRPQALGCSAYVDQFQYVRNYDFSPSLYDHCLSFIAPEEVFGSIGYNLQLIGRHDGVNEKGLAIGLHFVSNSGYQKGLSAWSVLRIALDTCETTQQVINLFKELPHAACYNFSVGDAQGSHAVIEVAPEKLCVRSSTAGLNCVNHFQHGELEAFNRQDMTSSVKRDNFLLNLDKSEMTQEELFDLFSDPASPLFFEDYDQLFGTLHTFAYSFQTWQLITSLSRGNPLEIDIEDWFAGKDLKIDMLYGRIKKEPTPEG
ncbi:C45 family peptidase [Terribacillus saccharophilus]|uniref:C45 family peptidase n=1 Tax=Terribacillus saccharophilus TaxID=361277 RepID=UPI002DC299F0|nr:C45 family autoproteolytic acyltransferase/hydrolase [Terribacillus saccharophilus]MEC0289976.1 C45 family autoproteolytic acyltransferase/hydrolase [Terribacillus saccharophilus]